MLSQLLIVNVLNIKMIKNLYLLFKPLSNKNNIGHLGLRQKILQYLSFHFYFKH